MTFPYGVPPDAPDTGPGHDELRFGFDGRKVVARPGDTVAAALAAAGVVAFRRTRSGAPRGLFCGMGGCADCLVTVDGVRSRRACATLVVEGQDVRTQREDDAGALLRPACGAGLETLERDVLVIGAGPAGAEAAIAAATCLGEGARVTMLDERGESGGQYYKARAAGHRAGGRLDRQHREGDTLRTRLAEARVDVRHGETVWYARERDVDGDGFEVASWNRSGTLRVRARAVIVAAGAFERPAVVPGWTLPGVMTIGAGQTLARRYGVSPGQRVLIASHGPLGLQLAAELCTLGVRVVAVAERGRPSRAALSGDGARAALASPDLVALAAAYRARLRRDGVPVLEGYELVACEAGPVDAGVDVGREADDPGGSARVRSAVLRRVGGGDVRRIEVDAVCAGDGFVAQAELARLLGAEVSLDPTSGAAVPRRDAHGATTVAGCWVAGDAGGLEGARSARAQGRIAGRAAACFAAGRDAPSPSPAERRALARARRFQRALWSLYRAPARELPPSEVVLCRCEEVTRAEAEAALDGGAEDLGSLKRATRLGMGRCQGRYCIGQAVRLLAARGRELPATSLFSPQPPARPVPVSSLAREKPEWAGHRESRPAARPSTPVRAPLALREADLVVVGGGVTGLCAALRAASRGARTLCIERGALHAEASGGNAGSLHLQLLSWDFGRRAVGDGSMQLATLALQAESIALWRELEEALGADFGMRVTGGLMVAEDLAQVGFLEAKVRAEASVGIASEVVDAARLRELVPALSERMVAGAWCPGEGKIDPLAVAGPVERAARGAGVAFEPRTPVTGIERVGARYRVSTPRGDVDAARVVIAAGGWSSALGRMLGSDLPVRGAPLQMIVTERAPPLVPCLLAHADRHLTMKQSDAGTIIIGGAWTAETAPSGQARTRPDSLEGNLWVAARTVPGVAGLDVLRSWAAMNIDVDGAPLLGPLPGHPRVVVAATANGYTLGPLMGRVAADAALDGRVPGAFARFGLERFDSPSAAASAAPTETVP